MARTPPGDANAGTVKRGTTTQPKTAPRPRRKAAPDATTRTSPVAVDGLGGTARRMQALATERWIITTLALFGLLAAGCVGTAAVVYRRRTRR